MYTSTSDEFPSMSSSVLKDLSWFDPSFHSFFFFWYDKIKFQIDSKDVLRWNCRNRNEKPKETNFWMKPWKLSKKHFQGCLRKIAKWVSSRAHEQKHKDRKKKKKKRGEEERNRRQTKHRVLVTFFSLQKESFCSIQRGWEKIYTMHYFIDVSTIT